MNSKRNAGFARKVPKTNDMEKHASLRWNVLRSVLALGVGFAIVPGLGSDVLAADTGKITRVNQPDTNLVQNNKADIYAEAADNKVGLNRFQDFQVGKNDMANLYFKTEKDPQTNLDTLVNTVQNRIDINGTVNAIRDNKIGGNLYFLSPKGMVVGAGGVINAGSLTAITTNTLPNSASGAADAVADIKKGNYAVSSSLNAPIVVNGTINTMTGIDLRAAAIYVGKDPEKTNEAQKAVLRTGMMFETTVNTDGLVEIDGERLKASFSKDGKIIIADPNDKGNTNLQGDGSIRIQAQADSRNTATEFLGITAVDNTVEAKTVVGEGATIDAIGNVDIGAKATISNATNIQHLWDFVGYSKAATEVNGTVRGADVHVYSDASSNLSYKNLGNPLDLLDEGTKQGGINVSDKATEWYWQKLQRDGKLGGKKDILRNVMNQLYMPFNITDAKATTTIGQQASVSSYIRGQVTDDKGIPKNIGGNLNVTANSFSNNVMKIKLQPQLKKGETDLSQYFTGGFIYEDSNSKAVVNVEGKLQAEKNVNVNANAKNNTAATLGVKQPMFYKDKGNNSNEEYASAMFTAAVGIVSQNTTAQVNIGHQAEIDAKEDLTVNANSDNGISSEITVLNKDDTALSTSINVTNSDGTAEVNQQGTIQGGNVKINAAHTMSDFSSHTSNAYEGEWTGVDAVFDSKPFKETVDKIGALSKLFGIQSQQAAGNNVQNPNNPAGQDPAWNQYFDVGASVSVANVENKATVNLKPTSHITSAGDVSIDAGVIIEDTNIVTSNILASQKDAVKYGASAAVAVENMQNTAEVNVEANGDTAIDATGKLSVHAGTEQRYTRVDNMVDDLDAGWEDFLNNWSKWKTIPDWNKKFQRMQNAFVDFKKIEIKDTATSAKDSKLLQMKAQAMYDFAKQLTGTSKLTAALEAFLDASNYANMYVAAAAKGESDAEATAMVAGNVGIQNLHNTANVNIKANAKLMAGDAVDVHADVVESNVLFAGKMALIPDISTIKGTSRGLGGSVGVQNAYANSNVRIEQGVTINAGEINAGTDNDVLNLGINFGGSKTSASGITGMVNYMGGESKAETLVDDDVQLTAKKKVEHVKKEKKKESDKGEYEDKVTASGAVHIIAHNNANVISLAGDFVGGDTSSVGVSTGVISYDVQTLAKVKNLEKQADGTSAETAQTRNKKGTISANSVEVSATTDGTINNLTVAGTSSGKSENPNGAAGGVNVAANGGQAAGGVQNAQINAGQGGSTDPMLRVNAAGSVSWNYVVDETAATLDNVDVTLTDAIIGEGVTDPALINDHSAALQVTARDNSYIGAYSGAMALTKFGVNDTSSFSGSLSGAIAVNDLKKSTTAVIGNTSTSKEDNVGVDILNFAQNSGAQVAAGLSLGVETGKRADGIAVNLGASGSANYVDSTVEAAMTGNTITGRDTAVHNVAYDTDVQVAGGVTAQYAQSSASVGAAVSINKVKNTIQAAMKNNTIGTSSSYAKEIHNIAASHLTQVGTAISVGVSRGDKSYAVGNVAVNTNTIDNNVDAAVDGDKIFAKNVSVEARDGKLSVDEAENPYMDTLNSVPSSVTIGTEGQYCDKNGNELATSFAVNKDGQKKYRQYTLHDDGYYYDTQGNKLNPSWDEKAQKPIYKDKDGYAVDVTDIQYLDAQGNPIDVLADEKRELFDLDGSDAMAQANGQNGSDFSASVTDGKEKADYTSSQIILKNQGNTIVGTALGLGMKTGASGKANGAGAVATSISHVQNNFHATVKNASIATEASEKDDAALKVIASSDTRMVSVAAGAAAAASGGTSVGLGVAGSGVKQTIENDTTATVEDTNIITDHLQLQGKTTSSLVSVAGQVSVTTSQNGVAGGLTWAENQMNNMTGAYARGLTLSGIDGAETSLDVLAENKANTWAVAAGSSVSLGYGAAEGAYASNHGTNSTEAIVEKSASGKGNTISKAKSISIQAKDTSSEKAVAGSVNVAAGQNAMASIGGAVSYNNIGNSETDKQHVTAKLSDAAITTADAGTVDVRAENKANLLNLALGGAVRAGSGSIGVSGQGSVAATTLYSDTYAGMQDVTISKAEKAKQKAKVTVKADSQSQVTNSADALSVSAGTEAQGAFGGAVSTIKSDADTKTELKNSNLTVDDLTAQAVSTNKALNIGIGLSVGASGSAVGASLAGNVASNKIENDTTVSVDGSAITADDTVAVLADSAEKLQNYGGAISVGASAGGVGAAVGTTIVTNTILGNTLANVSDSHITALGKGDGVSVNETTVDDTTHSVKNKEVTKKGLVVNANAIHTMKDLSVTAGVGASATAGVAADATIVINTIGGKTSAAISNTQINEDKTADLATADVSVTAYDKADINSHLGNVAVGAAAEAGVGAAGAGDRNTISRETVAQITGNQNTLNAHDVAVNALGETKIHVSESGVAAGASATGAAAAVGSVSDDRFTSKTSALVSGVTGTIHSLETLANRLANVATYNNAISLSGAIGSASVSVGVTNVEDTSQTKANISHVALTSDGSQDSQVSVKAKNDVQVSTELSGDALAVSLGGAAGISVANVNMESQVEATVDQTTLGQEDKTFGNVQVTAENDISHSYKNVAAGISTLLGVAVGKGAVNVNTGTGAMISNSQIYGGNIIVGADKKRNIQASMVGVGAGAANVGVNVMYTNVGTSLKDSYDYDRNGEGENASYDTKELQKYVNEALSRLNQQTEKAKMYDSSIEKGSTTINKGDASKAGLTTAVSNSTLQANDKLDIHAKATTNTDIAIHQAGIGIANVAVAANRMDVEDKLHVSITDAALQGNQVQIQSITDGMLKSYTGQGGFSVANYADTTGYAKHGGTNMISVDDSTITSTGHPLWLQARNQAKIENTSLNINVAGINAGRMVLDSEDSSEVAIQLGEKSKNRNILTASSIEIEAQNAPGVKSENKVDGTPIATITAKGVITTAKATGKATLTVSGQNTFDTGKESGKVSLSALTGGQGDDYYTTEAISHAVSVAGAGITVNKSRTYNGMEASTTLGAASFAHEETEKKDGKEVKHVTGYADVSVGASNATTSHGYIHSVGIKWGIASGSNFAQNHSDGKATTSIDTGNQLLQVKNLDAYASNSDTVEAKADGSSAGVVSISPYLARVENTVHSHTAIQVKGQILSQGDVHLSALQNGNYNLLANGLTVTMGGGGNAGAMNQITNDTSIGIDQAHISSGGDLLIDAENATTLNRDKGFEKMVMGTGWDSVGVDASRIDNTIMSNARVNLTDSQFISGGNAKVISHNEEDAQVNGYVYNVSMAGGAEASVNNTITNDDHITLKDSQIKTRKAGSDITLSAADDVKLSTYANAETATGVLTGANALLTNMLTRNNSIDISQGTNSLYSMQDIHLYAGKHADGSVSLLDLDAVAADFIGGAIPVAIRPSVTNTIQQNNQIIIGKDSASHSVRHSDFYAASGREMANVAANRYVGAYGSSEKGAFVTTDKGETIQGKTANNFVQVDGSAVAGVANKIDIVIGRTGDVVVRDKALRDTVVGGAKDTGDISISVKADESTGLTKNSLLFGTEDYTSTLYERYQEIENLMLEYAKDGEGSAAYQGYKAEAERIEKEMLSMGLAEKVDGQIIPKASLAVDYVEIPELTSSGGNITVDTDDLMGSGTLKAQGTPEISITNNTNLMTKIDGITVDDAGGKFVFNGTNLTGKTTADFNTSINGINKGKQASFSTVEAADGQSGKITINGNYNGNAIQYKGDVWDDKEQKVGEVSGSMKPMANILIQGNIYSKDGDVTIKSAADSIVIQGKGIKDAVAISGAKVTLDASKGNITQGYTDGIVNIGADVKSLYDQAYKDAISKGQGTHLVDQIKTDIQDGSKASGSYIAGGNVYINASDINVNGVIQSGFSDYYADISDAATKDAIERINKSYDGQRELSDAAVTTGDQYKIIDGGAVWDAKAGCYKYKLNVYYNPSTKKILVENIDASGGQIYLTGRISSTGNGQIICLDGVSDISVKNGTSHDLKVGQLTTHDVNGLVRIQDTAKKTLTEITNGKTVVKHIGDDGKISGTGIESAFDKTTGFDYKPKEGLKYTWTTGKESTSYTRYNHDFETGGWDLKWSSSQAKTELAKWMEEHPIPGTKVPAGVADRKQGEVIRRDTSTSGNQVTVSHQEVSKDMTVDGTRKWSSGLWGYYKHNEVTWTESTGSRDTYDASIQADNPIHVKFIGKAAEDGKISIDSASNVELTGNIGNTKLYETKNSDGMIPSRAEKGTVAITSVNGSLVQNGGSFYGADIRLAARNDIENIQITAGDTVHVSAIHDATGKDTVEQNTIDLTVNGAYQAKGNVVLGHVGSVVKDGDTYIAPNNSTGITGLVDIKTTGSEGTISQDENGIIVSDRINLTSENGSIYGQKKEDGTYTNLNVYAGQQPIGLDTLDASINATAKGDVSLAQIAGDMRIGQIISKEGDVHLNVSHGSVVDALPYVSNDRGDADDLIDRWRSLGLIDGNTDMQNAKNQINQAHDKKESTTLGDYNVWDENALLYAIQDSVVNQTSETLPKTSEKAPNVMGHNITITVADSAGINSGKTKEINTNTLLDKNADGSYKHLDELKALSKADASTVTWKKDDKGNTIAVISETLPIGVQQTTKDGKAGTLTVTSSAETGSQSQGNIFLEGREDKNTESNLSSVTKDLYLGNITTNTGNVTLRSLGGIYNAGTETTPLITGRNLYLSAANGSLGTAQNKLTTNLFGRDAAADGLIAIASGGIYIDQNGEKDLLVRSISSGKDIYLGSNKSILMGEVNGTDAVNYIRAENNSSITLEARGGSIGEAETDTTDNKNRKSNKGVRILNSGSENQSDVTLRAKDNVYVTGIASADGKTATTAGKAGSLDLTVGSVDTNSTLQNVGISVDGTLNLTGDVKSAATASIYTTTDITVGQSISSKDTYVGTTGNMTLAGDTLEGIENLTLEAEQSINQNKESVISKNTKAKAGKDINLTSTTNKLQNVSVDAQHGSAAIVSANDADGDLNVTTVGTVANNLTITNLNNGKANKVYFDKNLKAGGNITITNEEADIEVADGTMEATNISLVAKNNDVNFAGGTVTANKDLNAEARNVNVVNGTLQVTDNVLFTATKNASVKGGTISAKKVRAEAEKLAISGGSIKAATVKATKTLEMIGGTVQTGTSKGTVSADSIAMKDGKMLGTDLAIKSTHDIQQTGGQISATKATLEAGNMIDQTVGSVIAKDTVAKAGTDVKLSSITNKLQNVTVDAQQGSAIVVSANDAEGDLNVTTVGKVAKDLTITNLKHGKANAIRFDKNLQAGGNITITNEEADIEMANGTTMDSTNISLIAKNNGVKFAGGTVTAKEKVNAEANGITMTGSTLTAGTKTTLTANNGIDQTAGSIITKDIAAKAGTDVNLASKTNKLQNVSVDVRKGNATIVSANDEDGDLNVTTVGIVAKDLTITNLDNGKANTIRFNKNLKAGGTITITSEEADIEVANGTSMDAQNISLIAKNHDVKVTGGTVTAQNMVKGEAKNVDVAGGTISAKKVRAEAEKLAVSGGTIHASVVKATKAMEMTGGTIETGTGVGNISADSISMSNGTMDGNDLTITAAKDMQQTGGQISAAKVRLEAGNTIHQTAGSVIAKDTIAKAGADVKLASKDNKLQNVSIDAKDGSATVVSANDAEGDLNVTTVGKVAKDLTITNLKKGNANKIHFDKALKAGGTINITNEEADIEVADGTTMDAQNISLIAKNNDVKFTGGTVTVNKNLIVDAQNVNVINGTLQATDNVLLKATQRATVKGGTISAKKVHAEAEKLAISGGSIKAATVEATKTLEMTGGTVQTGTSKGTVSADSIAMKDGKMLGTDLVIKSTHDIQQIGGEITAAKAALEAGQMINQTAGSVIAKDTTAKAGADVKLASKDNKLQNVSVDAQHGSATVVSANDAEGDLNVTTVGAVAKDLTITNLKNGKANTIRLDKNLQAGGNITITNEEADIEVANGTMDAQNISLIAKNHDVKFNGGTVTATKNLNAEAQNVNVVNGTLQVTDNVLFTATKDASVKGGTISAKKVRAEAEKLAVSGGTIHASVVEATKAIEMTGGTIQTGTGVGNISANSISMSNGAMDGNDLTITAAKDMQQTGGQISAAKVRLEAGNTIHQTAGSVIAKDTIAKAGADVKLASKDNKLQNVSVDAQNGSATVVSANDAEGDLNVTTVGKVAKDLTITNLKHGKANAIRFDKKLQAGGDITITNEEADIEVVGGTIMEAKNISLLAKNNDVKISGGVVKARDQVKTEANGIIMSGGTLSAADAAFYANRDIVHTGGSMELDNKATLQAKGNILLQQGDMTATLVDMIAGGYVDETYDNEHAEAADSYNLTVKNTLQVQAGGKNAADDKDYGIDLGSKKNALSAVIMNSDNGNIILGNGGDQELKVSVQNGKQVNGSIEVHNFKSRTANDVRINGSLQATGQIHIYNDEKDIFVQGAGDDVIKGNDIQLTAAGSITNAHSIQASQNVSLMAHQDVINSGDVDAKDNILIMTEVGSVLNPGKLAAGDAVTIDAKKDIVNLGDAITANGNIRMKAGDMLWNIADIESKSSDVSLKAGKKVLNTTEYNNREGHGTIQAAGNVSITTTAGGEKDGVYNDADITAGQAVTINSQNTLENSGNIDSTNGDVLLFAANDVVNGVENSTGEKGRIHAEQSVKITSNKGNVVNYGNINSGDDVTLSSAWAYNQPDEKNADVVGNVTNFGSIQATKDVLLQTMNGNISNQNQITSADGMVKMKALCDTTYTGTEAVGNINNGLDTKTPDDNADITAAKGILLTAYGDVDNTGDYFVRQDGSIQVEAQHGTVFNWGKYTVDGSGNIAVISRRNDIVNFGDYQTKNGNVSMTAGKDVLNLGVMETLKGDVTITSDTGSIYNQMGADLISGDGNVTLHAKSQDAKSYYYNDDGELALLPNGANVKTYTAGEKQGGRYIVLGGKEYDVIKDGSVFNAGDALALNGTISFISDHGDVTNYDDFDILSNGSTQFNGKDIATSNVEISAAHGSLYNSKDIEAGGNISLTAAEGLQNVAYNLYAGKDITLHATRGDITNTSVLESVAGDVTLKADQGSITNGKGNTQNSGDIITLGGTVKLEAKKDVTNYGDIAAIDANAGDTKNAGSIILKSEEGNVTNYDDFNRIDDSESYQYQAAKHLSYKGLTDGTSYNVATNNIEISAAQGKLHNDKKYLVALNDVTLTAKDGLGSYGDVILAGGNISMTDTDGDLINRANLVSMDGDISLKADKGSVINVTKGKVVALNGNVTMNAGGTTENNHQIYLVDGEGKQQTLTSKIDVGDRILISESYYKDDQGKKHFLSNTELTAPEGKEVFTQVSYIDDNGKRALLEENLEGQLEAFRKGDVVNRGDIVSLNIADKSQTEAGNVILKSAYGNVSNYDDFKLVDGKKDDKGQGFYDFLGADGVAGENGAKFNKGTAYTKNKRYILSDSGIEMKAPEGYLYNDLALISHQDVLLESGKDLIVGTNFASVKADGNIVIRSTKGSVKNDSTVISNHGSIVLDGETGVASSGNRDSLQAVNGSISAVSTIGEVNIAELFAGKMAAAGTKSGSIKIGAIGGRDVVLYTEDGNAKITIGNGGITVKDHLFLQGNDFDLPVIDRSENTGTLVVDVHGVGSGGNVKGDLNLNIDGDVRFTTMNVTNADVRVGGKLSVDKLHVAGKGIFTSMGYVTGVYGIAPDHDSSNALYFDLGTGSGNNGLQLKAEEFRAIKEGNPEEVRALTTMRNLRERLDKAGTGADTFNTDNDGWMNLYVDGPRRQRSNGLLLHIDTYYHSANQRWSAEDLSAKLLDYRPVQSYETLYGDALGMFDRYNLWELLDDTEKQ